jgi:hypothetical protein
VFTWHTLATRGGADNSVRLSATLGRIPSGKKMMISPMEFACPVRTGHRRCGVGFNRLSFEPNDAYEGT